MIFAIYITAFADDSGTGPRHSPTPAPILQQPFVFPS
jgi:hypothetical protein